jgi:hypothetical protein
LSLVIEGEKQHHLFDYGAVLEAEVVNVSLLLRGHRACRPPSCCGVLMALRAEVGVEVVVLGHYQGPIFASGYQGTGNQKKNEA